MVKLTEINYGQWYTHAHIAIDYAIDLTNGTFTLKIWIISSLIGDYYTVLPP